MFELRIRIIKRKVSSYALNRNNRDYRQFRLENGLKRNLQVYKFFDFTPDLSSHILQ